MPYSSFFLKGCAAAAAAAPPQPSSSSPGSIHPVPARLVDPTVQSPRLSPPSVAYRLPVKSPTPPSLSYSFTGLEESGGKQRLKRETPLFAVSPSPLSFTSLFLTGNKGKHESGEIRAGFWQTVGNKKKTNKKKPLRLVVHVCISTLPSFFTSTQSLVELLLERRNEFVVFSQL